jgi:hypothetical protein
MIIILIGVLPDNAYDANVDDLTMILQAERVWAADWGRTLPRVTSYSAACAI